MRNRLISGKRKSEGLMLRYNRNLKQLPRQLRENMTDAERNLGAFPSYDSSIKTAGLVKNCEWHQFYDIYEVIWANPYSEYSKLQKEFSLVVNTLFQEEQLGFKFRDGKVERISSGPLIVGQVCCHSEGSERLKNLFFSEHIKTLRSAQGDREGEECRNLLKF